VGQKYKVWVAGKVAVLQRTEMGLVQRAKEVVAVAVVVVAKPALANTLEAAVAKVKPQSST
jgi:hypothetical protein